MAPFPTGYIELKFVGILIEQFMHGKIRAKVLSFIVLSSSVVGFKLDEFAYVAFFTLPFFLRKCILVYGLLSFHVRLLDFL